MCLSLKKEKGSTYPLLFDLAFLSNQQSQFSTLRISHLIAALMLVTVMVAASLVAR
jgi:hypothetical protein